MNRLGIIFFYDETGRVDDYMHVLIKGLQPFLSRIIFVSNGPLARPEEITDAGVELLIRENTGFDVGAYKHAIEHVGYDAVAEYDELHLLNHTFFGPIYPFSEMFAAMDARECDFWGITSHKEMIPNPFTNEGVLPRHINSHYIAVRQRMLKSEDFKRYWREMPQIKSYLDSIFIHETRFTKLFEGLGFVSSVYSDDRDYDSHYPSFINIDETIQDRCPILKRRPFFHEYLFHEEYAVDLPRALRHVAQNSDYPVELIWRNIIRSSKLRTLNTTAALTSIFPDRRLSESESLPAVGRIAVCAHIFYAEMTADLLRLAESIPGTFDFIATTQTEEKAEHIREVASRSPKVDQVIVRVVEQNRGRDMSALLITCRDLFLDDRYALVCRLHTKKSPQVDSARSRVFRHHVEESLLNSPGYVTNILDMFEQKPWVGLAVPPIIHIAYPTMGQSWFINRPRAEKLAKQLHLKVAFDDDTPVAPYGGMFWFRPKALRKLFEHPWKWEEFNAEPYPVDGALGHAIERLIAYVAQDAGYLTQHVVCTHLAEQNYVSLEYKAQKVGSLVGGTFRWQYDQLMAWKLAGSPVLKQKTVRSPGETRWKAAWNSVANLRTSSNHGEIWASSRRRQMNRAQALLDRLWTGTRASFWAWLNTWMDVLGRLPNYTQRQGQARRPHHNHRIFLPANPGSLLPFFDPQYYVEKYPEVLQSGMTPFAHFMEKGWRERFNPHPLFDTSFYLAWDPMIEARGVNPLEHYVRHGAAEGRGTHVAFDPAFYTETNPEVEEGFFDPLSHYLEWGATAKRDPHPLFDVEYYLSQSKDIAQDRLDPLSHYLERGAAEGLNPHPLFDTRYYLEQNPEVSKLGLNPLVHFLRSGAAARRKPHPLFDTAWYAAQYPEAVRDGSNPLVQFVRSGIGEMRNPNPLFDSAFYARKNPDYADSSLPPFMHYMLNGRKGGCDPHPSFRTKFYKDTYPDAAAANETPLAYYLRVGQARGDKISPES